MTYKLINTKTSEEHLYDKVTIDGFDYYVSDEKINVGDWYIVNSNFLSHYDGHFSLGIDCKKVIATNNPNIDIPQIVIIKECECNLNSYPDQKEICKDFCNNKSQETHSNSDTDIIEFYKWVNQPHPEDKRQPTAVYVSHKDFWWYNHNKYTSDELIQIWKEQKPKIVYYA